MAVTVTGERRDPLGGRIIDLDVDGNTLTLLLDERRTQAADGPSPVMVTGPQGMPPGPAIVCWVPLEGEPQLLHPGTELAQRIMDDLEVRNPELAVAVDAFRAALWDT